MNDFDLDLNFNFDDDFKPRYFDINGLVKKMTNKRRKPLIIEDEVKTLEYLIPDLPKNDETFKLLSVGGFSSISLINYIAEKEEIKDLYVSTFRIGKKQFLKLIELYEKGKINNVNLITSQTQEKVDAIMEYKGEKYSYYDFIKQQCESKKWKVKAFDNHSKLILARTKKNYYVIETSSNLNENPKMEQFSFDNDKELYLFYLEIFDTLLK